MNILIIDGNNLVHRVYWVSKNQPVFNELFHVYLFLNSVKTYTEMYAPDKIFCAWDEKTNYHINPRKNILKEYKETRDSDKNQEVHSQNEIIKKLLSFLGVKNIFPEKYEADDTIAVLHNFFRDDKKTIITADKDLCQLVDTNTVVYNPTRKIAYTIENFEQELGVKRELFKRMKAIQGDKSDNIPGLRGFGAVKTQKVLTGEIMLTEEMEIQVANNMKLVDLSLTLKEQSECEFVYKQLNERQIYDYSAFKELCEKCKFYQILNNMDYWNKIFYETKLV